MAFSISTLKSWLVPGSVVIILALITLYATRPSPLPVEAATTERRTLTILVEEQGRTRARDPYIVAAPITGRLLRSELDEGNTVTSGQLIARIALAPEDQRSEAISRANLTAAEARYAAAEAAQMETDSAYARARNEEQRRNELFKNNLTSQEEMEYYFQVTDSAEARFLSAQATLAAAAADVESARSRLLGFDLNNEEGIQEVNAPVDGTIYRVYEESERVVQAGTPLFDISNDDTLEIVIDLLTQDAVKVEAGDPVLISGWGDDRVISGRVSYIEPQAFTKISALGVEEQRVNVIGEFLEPHAPLGAGYRIEAGIVVWEEENILTVPTSAIFQRNNDWQIFVINDGEVELRQLELGQRGREFAQVLDGIAEGETIILYPSDLIEEGIEVSY